MQIKEIENKGLKRKYHITVPAATIEQEVETHLKDAGKNVKIPGFRPGFVPMKILKQRFGASVENDVLQTLLRRTTGDVLEKNKLRPALAPDITLEGQYAAGKDLVFNLSVESFPEVPEVKFEGITLARHTFDIDDKEIDDALARMAERSPKLVPAAEGTKAKNGHVVEIDFKGTVDGVAFDGGAAEHFELELGSGQFIPGFEDQLVGSKAGDDTVVKVTFPKDYGSANLAGKAAEFAVKVHQVLEKETPAIDEEFAKARGLADVAALRDAVKGQLNNEYNGLVRSQLKKALFDTLEETVEFPLPEGMVKLEFDNIWKSLKQAQAEGDESLKDKTDAELTQEYTDIAKRRVKLGLLLAEVGNKNKLQVTREELGRAAFQQALQFGNQARTVMEFYKKNPDRLEDLRGPIMEEKAVDFILSKVTYDDKKITIAELIKTGEEGEVVEKKPAAKKAKKK